MLYVNTIPFYTRDLSILKFWCPQGSWIQSLWVPRDNCIHIIGYNNHRVDFILECSLDSGYSNWFRNELV